MLYIYPEVVESVRRFVHKRWPEKEVTCQRNEYAWHQNSFIKITVTSRLDVSIIHYEYLHGYLELHFEGECYGNYDNQCLYKYLRKHIDTQSREYLWHQWYGMKQGRLRLEQTIETL